MTRYTPPVTAKLYKAAEVCDMTQLQPYVLRSWEKEFPGIGILKSAEGPRLYRQSDVDQVLRIKQLVFGEGLTLAGARRRLERSDGGSVEPSADIAEAKTSSPTPPRSSRAAGETKPSSGVSSRASGASIGDDVRARVAHVRDGLRSILTMLATRPTLRNPQGQGSVEEYRLEPPAMPKAAKVRTLAARRPAAKRPVSKRRSARV